MAKVNTYSKTEIHREKVRLSAEFIRHPKQDPCRKLATSCITLLRAMEKTHVANDRKLLKSYTIVYNSLRRQIYTSFQLDKMMKVVNRLALNRTEKLVLKVTQSVKRAIEFVQNSKDKKLRDAELFGSFILCEEYRNLESLLS